MNEVVLIELLFKFTKAEIIWLLPSSLTKPKEAITTTRQKQINIYHIAPVSEVGIFPVETLISMSLALLREQKY
jgi:hypothetical protein